MLRKSVQRAPELKSSRELALMREAGKLVARALKICREMATPGTRTADIDKAVDDLYLQHGATQLFKGYPAGSKHPFPASTCISFNEQVVHGIPGHRTIREGDLMKFDTACRLNGWCADRAITVPIGEVRPEKLRLLKVAEEVLALAMEELGRAKWWSEIARKMQKHVEDAGFSVVTQYVGHGIGRQMHEHPQVPNFVSRELERKADFRIEPGLVLAVEPMVNMGKAEVVTLGDHWTVVTKDGLPSVHVEHTLAVVEGGVIVITADEEPAVGE